MPTSGILISRRSVSAARTMNATRSMVRGAASRVRAAATQPAAARAVSGHVQRDGRALGHGRLAAVGTVPAPERLLPLDQDRPCVLGPGVLRPCVLGPGVLRPLVLGPRVLGPLVLRPLVLGPGVLRPRVLGPVLDGVGAEDRACRRRGPPRARSRRRATSRPGRRRRRAGRRPVRRRSAPASGSALSIRRTLTSSGVSDGSCCSMQRARRRRRPAPRCWCRRASGSRTCSSGGAAGA